MDFCDAVFYLRSNFHFSQVQRGVSYRRVDLFFDYSDKLKKLCKQWDRLNPILSIRAGMCAPFVSDNEDFVDDRIFADVMPSTSKTTGDEEAVSGVSVSLVVLWLILTKLLCRYRYVRGCTSATPGSVINNQCIEVIIAAQSHPQATVTWVRSGEQYRVIQSLKFRMSSEPFGW